MISQAAIIGRSHRLMHQNCHDFAVTGSPCPGAAFGLVLDGCGSKFRNGSGITPSHNEVGANLLGQFAAKFINEQLPLTNPPRQIDRFLADLYSESLNFLANLVGLYSFSDEAERTRFIATRLLSTLVGFLRTPDTAVFFWAGDGWLCWSGDNIYLDSGNQPDYLAYRLLGKRAGEGGGSGNEAGFQTLLHPHPDEIDFMAVATDGWQPDLLTGLVSPRNSLALQRWVNVQARRRGKFEDDGATAVWYREKSENDET